MVRSETFSSVAVGYAGFWRRFAAVLIDGLILGILGVVLGTAFGNNAGLSGTLSFLFGLAYQVYFFTSTGQTPGSKLLGIKVVDQNGQLLSRGSAVVRFFGSYVSAFIFCVGYLWMLWDPRKQSLHDKMAGSLVLMA